mgnify:CR=1 FL=1
MTPPPFEKGGRKLFCCALPQSERSGRNFSAAYSLSPCAAAKPLISHGLSPCVREKNPQFQSFRQAFFKRPRTPRRVLLAAYSSPRTPRPRVPVLHESRERGDAADIEQVITGAEDSDELCATAGKCSGIDTAHSGCAGVMKIAAGGDHAADLSCEFSRERGCALLTRMEVKHLDPIEQVGLGAHTAVTAGMRLNKQLVLARRDKLTKMLRQPRLSYVSRPRS